AVAGVGDGVDAAGVAREHPQLLARPDIPQTDHVVLAGAGDRRPSRETATNQAPPGWPPAKVCVGRAVPTSSRRTRPSTHAATTRLPSGIMARPRTSAECSVFRCSNRPPGTSQNSTVRSAPALMAFLLSGVNTMLLTIAACQPKFRRAVPLSASHSRTLRSVLPVRMYLPSGDQAEA